MSRSCSQALSVVRPAKPAPFTSAEAMWAHRQGLRRIAHRAVTVAVRRGKMPAASTQVCMDCGAAAEAWDHRDYRRQLEVEPVCSPCNSRRAPALPWAPRSNRFLEHGVGVRFSPDVFERIEAAANAAKMTVEDFVARAGRLDAKQLAPPMKEVFRHLGAVAIDFDEWVHGRQKVFRSHDEKGAA